MAAKTQVQLSSNPMHDYLNDYATLYFNFRCFQNV